MEIKIEEAHRPFGEFIFKSLFVFHLFRRDGKNNPRVLFVAQPTDVTVKMQRDEVAEAKRRSDQNFMTECCLN